MIFLIEFAQQIRNASLSGRRALQVSKEFAYVGVLTVFETRKGIEKIPVVLTGKSKLHVFLCAEQRKIRLAREIDMH
ncbi:MAG: hypothetical protein SOV73_00780, partial [Candidatus Faecivivens sp.]|nr:hypothetical protein [Candidatus Faecivivens sp.]